MEVHMFKTILVHLRGTSGDKTVLSAALEAARPSAAHLDCVHIRPNLGNLISRVAFDLDEDTDRITESLDTLRKLTDDVARAAAQAFADFCANESVTRVERPPAPDRVNAAFSETVDDELHYLITQSWYHDLVVVKGGSEEAGGLAMQAVGRLIINAGRPVLLAPNAHARKIRTVAIAWKDVPEAARAITAAMPLISKAENIFVFNASEEDEQAADSESVIAQFRWHGHKAEAHRVVPGERSAPDALLETARAAEADLLVMGAYGRNRLSELVFGGFTQRILEDASLPVLLFH
jgi:nucleotide-binding universal stress UspA family protein